MAENQYKVADGVKALLVPKAIAEFDDGSGNISYEHQQVTYYEGEPVPRSEISPEVLASLDGDEGSDPRIAQALEGKLVEDDGSGAVNVGERLGLPFAGYDDLSEDEVLEAFVSLPSAAIAAVKDYEAGTQGRERILAYNVGLREGPYDRLEGRESIESTQQDAEVDPVASKVVTREVDGSDVTLGEGVTGSDPTRSVSGAIDTGNERAESVTQPVESVGGDDEQVKDDSKSSSRSSSRSSSKSDSDSSQSDGSKEE